MPAAVVAHGGADILRHPRQAADEFLGGAILQITLAGERGVEVVDVRLMVLAVVDLHGHRVDDRFQGVGA